MPPMQKITDIFAHKKLTFSFELFPPKTEEGYVKLLNTMPLLCDLKAGFYFLHLRGRRRQPRKNPGHCRTYSKPSPYPLGGAFDLRFAY